MKAADSVLSLILFQKQAITIFARPGICVHLRESAVSFSRFVR